MEKATSTSGASAHVDFVRGLSALVVLVNHGRSLFFVNAYEVATKGVALKAFYFLTAFGHQAVMVFFVLSGYFISSSVFRARREGRWSWRNYGVDRASRIYVVLIPAIGLTLLLDYLGMAAFPGALIYRGTDPHGLFKSPIAESYASGQLPAVILGNLLGLQAILVPALGSNPPLWTLSYEIFYYVLFPATLVFLAPGGRRGERLACGVFLAVVGTSLAGSKWYFLWFYLVIWLFGAAVAFTGLTPRKTGRSVPWPLAALALVSFVGSLPVARFRLDESPSLGDLLVGGAFTVLLLTILLRPSPARPGPYLVLAKTLSGFSYSLYVLHVPLLVFLRAVVLPGERWQPDFVHISAFLGLSLLVVSCAALFSRLTEARTGQVRRAVTAWIGERTAASPRAREQPETSVPQAAAAPLNPGEVVK